MGAKIRVTHLITDLARGGAEIFLKQLVTAPQDGVEHRVISLTSEGDLGSEIRASGVDVSALSLTGMLDVPRALVRLRRLLREQKPDVLMTWLYHADFFGTVAAALGPKISLVWNIRCADMDLSKYGRVSRALPHVLAWLSHRPATVVANSTAGKKIHERYGYRPKHWEILPNGFDIEAFRPDPARREKVRTALGIDREAPVVGLFARFDPMKDHATFLNAAAQVVRSRPDILFLLAGRGTEGRGFSDLIGDRPGLRSRLILLGERRDMPELIGAVDIAVCSSLTEGFPNAVGEAMASGVPCVSTDVGDAAALIGDTGKIVPVGDAAAMARAIEEVLALPVVAKEQAGHAARDRIAGNYALNKVVFKYGFLCHNLKTAE